jgi:opacity protein-like surface antigen
LKIGFYLTTVLLLSLGTCSIAGAQAAPTASQRLQVDGFGALTGTYTGLSGGRNLGITAGLDVGWKSFYGLYPSLELRGTYPIDGGHIDAQENVLYGIKLAKVYGRFHPYGDFLVGRDKIVYQKPGYPDASGTLLYLDSVSNVFSVGGGVDLDVTDQVALKIDGQFQRYGVPVNTSRHIYSKPLSIGIVYRFDFNHRLRYNKDGQLKGYKPAPEPRSERLPLAPDPAASNSAPSAPAPDSDNPPPPPSDTPASSQPSPASPPPSGKPSPYTPAPSPQVPQPPQ